MTQRKKPRPAPASDDECTKCVLSRCPSWAAAEAVARRSLVYILKDGDEAAANRIKAAALVLDAAMRAGKGTADGESIEDWLERAQTISSL